MSAKLKSKLPSTVSFSKEEQRDLKALSQDANPKIVSDKKKKIAISANDLDLSEIDKFLTEHPNEKNRSQLLLNAFRAYRALIEDRKVVLSGVTVAEF